MTGTTENITVTQPVESMPKDTANTEATHDLILHYVKLCASRRIAWLRKSWAENGADDAINKAFNTNTEIDGCLNITDTPVAEREWYSNQQDIQNVNNEIENVADQLRRDKQSRLLKLADIFGLSEPEKDILQACLALYIDPNLGRVYAYLQDHNGRSYVTRQLVARLFQHGQFLSIGSSSPLFIWGLVAETEMGKSEPARLDCDPFIRNWLLGSDDMDNNLVDIARIQAYYPALESWPVNETASSVNNLLDREQQVVRLFITGAEKTGKRSFAAAVCKQLKLPLLSIRTNRMNIEQWPTLFMQAQRQAWLGNCALLWEGNIAFESYWPIHIQPYPVQFVVGEKDQSVLPAEIITDMRFEMPPIPVEEAYLLWQKFVPASTAWPKDELMQVIKRQPAGIGLLTAVSKNEIKNTAEASEALRSFSRQRLGKLAQLINSSFLWDDLVVPATLRNGLDDFYFEATERAKVWEDAAIKKYFPQGRGLIALFTGPPGTGKTMAAQVIANSLQLDLFRIDLSAVVSKYIGETSKNMERILSRAADMNAVLLFDEADALFGKRTDIKDAHDRFANTDTNYMLQAIEEYPGIAILASNKKAGIDPAFYRRFRCVLDFPKPDAQHRLQLWQKLLTELTGKENAEALNNDISRLSELLEVTGAQIKQSILSAIFSSRRENKGICINHLVKGIEKELIKENRGIGRQVQEMMK
ncbi:MAG: AAA family ATPase [Segetibacter sp.]